MRFRGRLSFTLSLLNSISRPHFFQITKRQSVYGRKPMDAVKTEIDYAYGEVPLRPNVIPVIILKGSDHDMGYQYIYQVNQIFGRFFLDQMKQARFTNEELDNMRKIDNAIKDYAPEIIDMVEGIVAGAADVGVPLLYNEVISHEFLPRFPGFYECTGSAAWGSCTKDGKLIIGSDMEGNLNPFRATFVAFPDKGNSFIWTEHHITVLGWAGHPAMNDKGLCYVHHASPTLGEQSPGYLANGVKLLHILRNAGNASQAREMLMASPPGGSGFGGIWADTGNDCFVAECLTPPLIRKAGDYGEQDFVYATNTQQINNEQMRKIVDLRKPVPPATYVLHGGWLYGTTIDSIDRGISAYNFYHNYHGQIDEDVIKMFWRQPGKWPEYPTLHDGAAAYTATLGKGYLTMAGGLNDSLVTVVQPDKKLFDVASGHIGRIQHPQGPKNPPLVTNQTFTFYRLKLSSGPEEVTRDSQTQATYDLEIACRELTRLTYRDVAYAPLLGIYNKAVTEWEVGNHYQVMATTAKGSDSLYNFSRATRGFTRAQALARQVYESLVPPPTKPEDLGLKPWLGDRGEWATR
jgi:hypothetical protein